METQTDKAFGQLIASLIQKEDLPREDAREAFSIILNNQTTELQQGAFLSALVAKGETADEVSGCWEAVYDIDTVKVDLCSLNPVDNCGTGMDSFKTFNISTAASIIAAAGGVPMARHGARAISSVCGTVDMAESLGVDVDCSASIVAESIKKTNLGLFNGMSPESHPAALGRLLSQIYFGSTLNISASLANPALPKIGVRGVYQKGLILPVLQVMKGIGYKRALTIYGAIDDNDKGMDEASVCGTTYGAELFADGSIKEIEFRPEDFGLNTYQAEELSPLKDIEKESIEFLKVLNNCGSSARTDAAILNAALIFYIAEKVPSIQEGINLAKAVLEDGRACETLKNWIQAQNRDAQKGLNRLDFLLQQI